MSERGVVERKWVEDRLCGEEKWGAVGRAVNI